MSQTLGYDYQRKRRRSLVTPEGASLGLLIAEASERGGAFLIDLTIMMAALIVVTLGAAWALSGAGLESAEPIAIIWLLAFFFLRNFYFIAFEMGPKAATPGKRVLGLRVASRDGGRLTAQAIFARNAMRELEVFLPISFLFSGATDIDGWIVVAGLVWSGIFVFFPLFNLDKLRTGDIIAGTWVIKAPKRTLVKDLAQADARTQDLGITFTDEQLDAYGVRELQVLEDVLRQNNDEAVAAVADRIRWKISYVQGAESDRIFLNAYYTALRHRLEAKLLMGKRRRDKHDRA